MGFYDNLRRKQAIEHPELEILEDARRDFLNKFGFMPMFDQECAMNPVEMAKSLRKAIESEDSSEFTAL